MNVIQRVIIEPSERFFEKVIQFLPNFFTAIVVLLIGVALAFGLKIIFRALLKAVSIDKFFERSGTSEMLRKWGMRESISVLFSKLIQWIVVIIFSIIAMRSLEIPTVERLLENFLMYLPNIFVALVILLFGYMLSNFLGRAALIGAVNSGLRASGLIGKLVKLTIFFLAVTMALEQLGIGRGTVIIAFAIIFGGIVLAFSIAFGLGGRDAAKAYLEKKLNGEEQKDDISHL